MKKIVFQTLFCLLAFASFSQKKLQPEGAIRFGLLEGEAGNAVQLEATAGLRYNTWSAAVGGGIDYYGRRSVPVFLQLQKRVCSGAKTPFVYADGGVHFPWLTAAEKSWAGEKTSNGFYGDAGIGYQLPVAKTSALQFSLGYSVKAMTSRQTLYYMDAFPWAEPPVFEEHYTLRRISLKMGLRF